MDGSPAPIDDILVKTGNRFQASQSREFLSDAHKIKEEQRADDRCPQYQHKPGIAAEPIGFALV